MRAPRILVSPAEDFRAEPPNRSAFVNPYDDPRLISYFDDVHAWHGTIKFLGLPQLKETSRDVPIGNLFVEPLLSPAPLTPESFDQPATVKNTLSVVEALQRDQRLVVLGDPGTGKTTLINWLCESFTRPVSTGGLGSAFGPLVPLPMILRDLTSIDDKITWQGLLDAFLRHGVAEQLCEHRDLLDGLLKTGQAFVLLDGLDEISNAQVRRQLRLAVREGFRRFRRSRWLLTSRIVGYDDAPLHESPGAIAGDSTVRVRDHLADLLYVAPFDHPRIERFARNWYRQHESNPRLIDQQTAELLRAIDGDAGTRRLARVPNLLTFMALIYRTFAQLPHGRALLYAKISEAYLDTIDAFRKLPPSIGNFTLAEKERWLAHLGFRMQLRRVEAVDRAAMDFHILGRNEAAGKTGEILVPERELLGWLTQDTAAKLDPAEAQEAAALFLDYLGRRSGLLVPRGEGLYAFMHLSFQEYYAARHLAEAVRKPRWQSLPVQSPESLASLRSYAGQHLWRETLLLLFECLADAEGWPKELASLLADRPCDDLPWAPLPSAGAGAASPALMALLATVSIDPHVGLRAAFRRMLWRVCWHWELEQQQKFSLDEGIAPLLTGSSQFLIAVLEVLGSEGSTLPVRRLRLAGCTAVSDLRPLEKLGALETLWLDGCTAVSDLRPLEKLGALETLSLAGCAAVSDLRPLDKLGALHSLSLDGCTAVSDLRPLDKLGGLKTLWLDGCTGVKASSSLKRLRERVEIIGP